MYGRNEKKKKKKKKKKGTKKKIKKISWIFSQNSVNFWAFFPMSKRII